MSGRRAVWVLLPLLALTLALQVPRALRRWQASRILAVVKTVTVEASRRGRLSRRLLECNIELLRQAESFTRADVALQIARGGQYLLLNRPQAAIRAFQKAGDLEPRGEIYAQLGRAYLKAGDRHAAAEAFELAILLDHNQRQHLRGYLGRGLGRRSKPSRSDDEVSDDDAAADGEIFSDAFDSGSLRRWRWAGPRKDRTP